MTYEKEREKISQEIKDKEKLVSDNETEISKLRKEKYEKVKPIEEEMGRVTKPYNDQIHLLEKQNRDAGDKIRELNRKSLKLVYKESVTKAKQEGQYDADTFTDLLNYLGYQKASCYDTDAYIEKKPLKNGIQIFRVKDDYGYSEWFAFDGLRCIGFSYRKAGEHMGDQTYPYSFIGTVEKEIEKEVEGWGRKSMTFTDWKNKLSEMTPEQVKKLPEIELGDPKVMEKTNEHRGLN